MTNKKRIKDIFDWENVEEPLEDMADIYSDYKSRIRNYLIHPELGNRFQDEEDLESYIFKQMLKNIANDTES